MKNCVDCQHLKQKFGYVIWCDKGMLLDGNQRVKIWKRTGQFSRDPKEWKHANRCYLFDDMGDLREIEEERSRLVKGLRESNGVVRSGRPRTRV